jgi:NAD(P)H-dependent FMN reductase
LPKPIVVAISGSLRKLSFTEKMLDLFVEGMGENVEFHKFYPHKMNIKPCMGCLYCWTENPGVCVNKDDYQKFFKVFVKADYFIIAAPLYVYHLPATVKNMIDRMFINLEPGQNTSDSRGTIHPKRHKKLPKLVLISSCGFPEIENFDHLREYVRIFGDEMEIKLVGEILISAAGLHNAPKLFDKKYELIKKAGSELISKSQIRKETTEKIAKSVMSNEDYRKIVNARFSGGIIDKIKMTSIAIKAISKQKKSKN